MRYGTGLNWICDIVVGILSKETGVYFGIYIFWHERTVFQKLLCVFDLTVFFFFFPGH